MAQTKVESKALSEINKKSTYSNILFKFWTLPNVAHSKGQIWIVGAGSESKIY